MKPWKTIDRATLFRVGDGRRLIVENHTVELPDGQRIDDWAYVRTPDYVNIVAVTNDHRFPIFRQTKYAVPGITLALPGGYLEPSEEPLAAAKRELLEETGYSAATWRHLGCFAVDGNRGCGNGHLFLAENAIWQQPIDADDLEEQELLLVTQAELEAALYAGEFQVLSWTAAVAMALLALRSS